MSNRGGKPRTREGNLCGVPPEYSLAPQPYVIYMPPQITVVNVNNGNSLSGPQLIPPPPRQHEKQCSHIQFHQQQRQQQQQQHHQYHHRGHHSQRLQTHVGNPRKHHDAPPSYESVVSECKGAQSPRSDPCSGANSGRGGPPRGRGHPGPRGSRGRGVGRGQGQTGQKKSLEELLSGLSINVSVNLNSGRGRGQGGKVAGRGRGQARSK